MVDGRDNLRRWLAGQPHMGWQVVPTAVTGLPHRAHELGLDWLGVKRDDLATVLCGGTKVRKLDALLAAEPWYSAQKWTTVGALGSGHLVACTAAAEALGRQIAVDVFGEPLQGPAWAVAAQGAAARRASEGVLDNLAYTVGHVHELHFHRNRATLALTAAPVLMRRWFRGGAVIPPGATVPEGMVGLLRAALELADQVARGELPMPARLYVALGSGGTAVGLAVGCALAGLPLTIHAVRTVEAPLASRHRFDRGVAGLCAWLAARGLELPAGRVAVPVRIDGTQMGRGYGWPTVASQQARMMLQGDGIAADDVYTGKAWAALLADARRSRPQGGAWLFWNTVRGPLPVAGARDLQPQALARHPALPAWLRGDIRAALRAGQGQGHSRRWLLRATGVGVAGWMLWRTLPDGPQVTASTWHGQVLSAREAATVVAAAAVLLDPPPRDAALVQLAVAVDAYVAHLSSASQREVHLLLATVEHGHAGLPRFSFADADARLRSLLRWRAMPRVGRDLFRGVRDLVMLGWYQQAAAWPRLGYGGPWVDAAPRPRRQTYARLVAADGQLPPGATR